MYCMFYIVYVYLYMYKVLLILFIYLLYFDDQINAELVSIRNFHNHKKKTLTDSKLLTDILYVT